MTEEALGRNCGADCRCGSENGCTASCPTDCECARHGRSEHECSPAVRDAHEILEPGGALLKANPAQPGGVPVQFSVGAQCANGFVPSSGERISAVGETPALNRELVGEFLLPGVRGGVRLDRQYFLLDLAQASRQPCDAGVLQADPAPPGPAQGPVQLEADLPTADDPLNLCPGPIIRFGTLQFCVNPQWLAGYLGDPNRRIDPSSFLRIMWKPYFDALDAQDITLSWIHTLIGCWDFDTTQAPAWSTFWTGGWGAPHRFTLHAVGLAAAYSGQIKDTVTGTKSCRGLGDFIRDVAKGLKPDNKEGETCRFTLNVRGGGIITAGRSTIEKMGCPEKAPCPDSKQAIQCGSWRTGDNPCMGNPWYIDLDSFRIVSDPNGNPALAPLTGDTGCDGGTAFAQVQCNTVNFSAARIGTLSFATDFVLFLARMAYDYGREFGSASALECARGWASYALRLVSFQAQQFIHEAGHCYIGRAGHCDNYHCCFDIAASHWACKVAGMLRLPWHYSFFDHRIDPGDQDVLARCGSQDAPYECCFANGRRYSFYGYRCRTKKTDDGTTRSPSSVVFCGTNCTTTSLAAAQGNVDECGASAHQMTGELWEYYQNCAGSTQCT